MRHPADQSAAQIAAAVVAFAAFAVMFGTMIGASALFVVLFSLTGAVGLGKAWWGGPPWRARPGCS